MYTNVADFLRIPSIVVFYTFALATCLSILVCGLSWQVFHFCNFSLLDEYFSKLHSCCWYDGSHIICCMWLITRTSSVLISESLSWLNVINDCLYIQRNFDTVSSLVSSEWSRVNILICLFHMTHLPSYLPLWTKM